MSIVHRLFRDLRFMAIRATHLPTYELAISILILLFALVFLVVGVSRTVEFDGLGISARLRKILITLHIMGCVIFSFAIAIFAIDTARMHVPMIGAFLIPSLIILLPVHIYIGLHRRIILRDKMNS